MARKRDYDVPAAVELLNEILQMELATVVYYTHYAFMIYGHARIPIRDWMNAQAEESLGHARLAGDMITHLGHRPRLGIAPLPTRTHNTIDDLLAEAVEREEAGVQLYRDLLAMIRDKSPVLEDYCQKLIGQEAVHVSEMRLMLMKTGPEVGG